MTDADRPPQAPHPYTRACRNEHHSGCTCMHPVDGRWCGKSRSDPVHDMTPAQPEVPQDGAQRIARLRADQAAVVQPDTTILFLLGEIDRLSADVAFRCQQIVELIDQRDAALAENAALREVGDAVIRDSISRTSPPGTTAWQSRCLHCTFSWWDGEPERHLQVCPVAAYRALRGGS